MAEHENPIQYYVIMPELLFATHNANKVLEVRQILGDAYQVITPKDIHFNEDVDETGRTFQDNARIKVDAYESFYSGNVFAEDTGLEVDALNGAPGVYTARFAGINANASDNMNKLLNDLKNESNRSAQFKTVVCLKLNNQIYYFEGICKGSIAQQKTGKDGFGYDPIFIPDGFTKSFAELGGDIKKKVSHRAIAMQKMIDFLLNE